MHKENEVMAGIDYIAPQNLDTYCEDNKKLIEEIDKEIMRSVLIPKLEFMPMTELPSMTTGNYANQYQMYEVPVIEDPTKLYILNVDLSEEKKPWYKRLWLFIKNIFKHLRYERR